MSSIDVGAAAINRGATGGAGITAILLDNPANLTGRIKSVEIWAATNLTGLIVGTFYLVSGVTYKCRDSEAIGAVTAGSKQTFSVDINVTAGDFIGLYFTAGTVEAEGTGGAGLMYIVGEYIDPNDQADYTFATGDVVSLYGNGIVDYSQSLSSGIGLSVSLVRAATYGRPLNTAVGLSTTLGRTVGFIRSLSTAVWEDNFTIAATDLSDDLVNFPVHLDISAAGGKGDTDLTSIFDELGSSCLKLKILDSLYNQCYVEIVSWDSDNEVAELHFRAPALSDSVDNVFTIQACASWDDNSTYVGLTGSAPAMAVWDANFKAVYHMKDGADTSHIYDSTSNDNDGTKKAANEPLEATGSVGKAQQFDGTNAINCGDNGTLDLTDAITIEIYGKIPAILSASSFMLQKLWTYRVGLGATYNVDPVFRDGTNEVYARYNISANAGLSTYLAATCISTSNPNTITYVDGVSKATAYNAAYSGLYNAGDMILGGSAGAYYIGTEDEVRISNTVRSPDWIAATNKSLTDTLVTFATPQVATGIGFSATLQRIKGFVRSLTTSMGLSAVLSHSFGFTRSLSTAIGLTTTLQTLFGFVRSLTTSIGLQTLLIWGGRFKRRRSDTGTDRDIISSSNERDVSTEGDNRDRIQW